MGRGRAPCCDKTKVKKGPWSPAEDLRLTNFIQNHGHSNWRALPKQAGLLRCGKSCRLRWINYLRPDVKRGNFTSQEEQTIINLHNSIGNKWSKIASYLPGRTDNEIKNVWNTHLKKRLKNKGTTDQCGNKNYQANDPKPNYSISASPSCTSVSSITSSPNPNTENALIVHQEPGKPNKDVVSVHSPTSSHHTSNFSNSNETSSEFAKSEVINEEEKVEIPLESDTDFWELFDSLGTNQEPRDATNNNIPREEKIGDENECSKWFRLLENELGLTCDDGNMANDVQDIVPTTMEMDLEPETGPELDYFPIWPSSPQNLGI